MAWIVFIPGSPSREPAVTFPSRSNGHRPRTVGARGPDKTAGHGTAGPRACRTCRQSWPPWIKDETPPLNPRDDRFAIRLQAKPQGHTRAAGDFRDGNIRNMGDL